MPFKNQQIITFGLLVIGALFAISQALKPNEADLRFSVQGDTAYVFGGTDTNSILKMTNFIAKNPGVENLVLKYMPGTSDADMNLRIARQIRDAGLTTHLASDSYIASGAVDLFLAGTQRTMECGASIGVHSWSLGGEFSPAQLGTDRRQKYHERFLRDMGIDETFYVFTREAAPPESIHVMSMAEIRQYKLLTQDPEC